MTDNEIKNEIDYEVNNLRTETNEKSTALKGRSKNSKRQIDRLDNDIIRGNT